MWEVGGFGKPLLRLVGTLFVGSTWLGVEPWMVDFFLMVNVGKYTITGFCGYISVKLTAFSHCKWMVGRRSFLFGSRPTFQGDLLVFGSVIREFRHKKPVEQRM